MKHYFSFLTFSETLSKGDSQEMYHVALERATEQGYSVSENPAFFIKK